ncbi:DUF1799 domain-containing protein [Pseudomonas sp. ANT_J28]|uniref:DUF1799 domain-containing protein n=1 Tax=Pseudomonas sp. ANT_J28 TaxID=2597352 RepID=UPI0011F17CBF|nr:DUF1799 domain-containing protein [Pseudomonas sp. ANT_J28]KAA0983313.1 hypothetical protein FQ187_12935 [Pseudomonas sp. ANT_J28]
MVGDLTGQDCEVWPDVWQAFQVFEAMSTQWRTGACGATGLDYTSIRAVAGFLGLTRAQATDIFPDLRIMEAEALRVMAEQRDSK